MNKEYTDIFLDSFDKPDEVKVNGQLLVNALALFASAATLLNEVNQKAFHDKLYDRDKISQAFKTAEFALHEINGTHLSGEEDNYNVDPQVLYGLLGVASTSGELIDALLQVMLKDHDFKLSFNILNEIGDIAKFQTLTIDALDGDWEHILYTVAKRTALEQQEKERE